MNIVIGLKVRIIIWYPYDPSMLAISTPVPFGKVCEAFPDGRMKGDPLADGVLHHFRVLMCMAQLPWSDHLQKWIIQRFAVDCLI